MADVIVNVRAEDNFSDVLGNFGSIITGIESAINLVGRAFDAAVDAITPFVESASESEMAITNLEATLRSMGDVTGFTSEELQGFADSLQSYTVYSDEAIINTEAMLLTFGNIGGNIFPEALAATVDLAAKFGSLDQAAIMLGKALNDPIAGVTSLRRVGVQLSEQQEEAIRQFVELGDIESAQAIILAEVNRQVGGLAEAYGRTFAGSVDIAKNKLDEFREVVGGPIMEMLRRLLEHVVEFAETNPVIQNVLRFFERWNELLTSDLEYPVLVALAGALAELRDVSPLFQDLAFAVLEVQNALRSGDDPFTAIAAGLESLRESWEGSPLGDIVARLQEFISTAQSEGLGPALRDLFVDAWTLVSPHIDTFFANLFASMENHIRVWIDGGGADRLSMGIINALNTTIRTPQFQSAANVAAQGLADVLGTAFVNVANNLEVAGTDAMRNFWDGMEVGITNSIRDFMNDLEVNVTDAVRDFFNNWEMDWTNWVRTHIVDPIKNALGIHSASTVFMSIGRDIILGLISGIGGMTGELLSAFSTIISRITQLPGWDEVLDFLGVSDGGTTGGRVTEGGGGGGGLGGSHQPMPGNEDGSDGGGSVTNIYNFYGTTHVNGVGPEGTYDCEPTIVQTGGLGSAVAVR